MQTYDQLKVKALKCGLRQFEDSGLKRIIRWRGRMLLNGAICERGLY